MPYKVQFVGLVCFLREPGGRLALLPDGRDPGNGIDPHYGSIVIAANDIEQTNGWPEAAAGEARTFPLVPCEIVLEGTDVPGVVDTTNHEALLPQLRRIDPNFAIDPDRAQTIAKLRIRRGKLTAYYIPGGTALVSQLEVPHDGPILITVTPDDGSPVQTIRVKPGTEIAVTNMAGGSVYDNPGGQNGSHFKIYEKLSVNPVSLTAPSTSPPLDELPSQQILFSRRGPISLYHDCPNTGCC
jgi:hypothetical protein